MNGGGNSQYPQYAAYNAGVDAYSTSTNEDPVNMMTSHSQHGMMPQPYGMMPQQYGSGMMPQQYGSGMTSQQYGGGMTSQQYGSGMTSQQYGSGMTSQQYGNNTMSQQPPGAWGMSQASGNMMPPAPPANPAWNYQQPDTMPPGQFNTINMGQQGGWNSGPGGMNMGQTGMNTAQNVGCNTSHGGMNMERQGGMNMSQSGMNMGLGGMNIGPGGMTMEQQGNMNVPQQCVMNTEPQQSISNVGQQGSVNMLHGSSVNLLSQESSTNVAAQGNSFPKPNSLPGVFRPIPGNSDLPLSAQISQHSMTMQQGQSNSVYQQDILGKNNSNSSSPTFQPGAVKTSGMNKKLDEFYAAIETDIQAESTAVDPQQLGFVGDADAQSDTVSSTTQKPDSGPTELQLSIGQKLLEISSQMVMGKSSLGLGSMSNAVSHNLGHLVVEEPDSSTSLQPGASTSTSTSRTTAATTTNTAITTKLSSQFEDEDTDYCKLCNIYFTSKPMYAFHVRGVAHIQRVMAVEAGKDRQAAVKPFIVSGRNFTQTVPQECENQMAAESKKARKKKVAEKGEGGVEEDYLVGPYCDVCELHMETETILWRHMSGKRHLKALKAVQEGTKSVPDGRKRSEGAHMKEGHSDLDKALASLPADEPVVGLQFVVETVVGRDELFVCELCEVQCSRDNMLHHIIGLKHRLAYLRLSDYGKVSKKQKKSVRAEQARLCCMEAEKVEGRGQPRYRGPPKRKARVEEPHRLLGREVTPPPAHLLRYREQQYQMSESEKRLAVESLKRTLLDDFQRRNIEPELAGKILESRLELLREYERRGVPFVVARERVIEEEERWNLLLEFERQILPFEEAEQRIDHRFELMKMYEKKGFPSEEARRKVLDGEVIHDFKGEFLRLGLRRDQAKKQAEKRLWMLETLHFQGLTPEDASHKVINIEKEVKRSLSLMQEEEKGGRGRGESQAARWMVVGEELEQFVASSCLELGVTPQHTQAHMRVAVDALERYRKQKIPPEEAKCRVLVDDLAAPAKIMEATPPEESLPEPGNDPGSQADISKRVQQFVSKIKTMQSAGGSQAEDKAEQDSAGRERQLEEYDQHSRIEIQNLLSEMLKMNIPADEARRRLVALYKQHETIRESLFPSKKPPRPASRTTRIDKDVQDSDNKPHSQPLTLETGQASAVGQSLQKQEASNVVQRTEGEEAKEGNSAKPTESPKVEVKANKESPAKEPKKEQENSSSQEDAGKRQTETQAPRDSRERSARRSRSRDRRSPRPSRGRSSRSQTRKSVSAGSRDRKRSPNRNIDCADDRWKSSVEMFLQQYGLKKDDVRSDLPRRLDRYSPSDISPRSSRPRSNSRTRHRPRQSPPRGRPRSRSASRSPVSLDRCSSEGRQRFLRSKCGSTRSRLRLKERSRSRSRSGSGVWRSSLRRREKSRSKSRSGSATRRRPVRLRSRSRSISRSRSQSRSRSRFTGSLRRRSPSPGYRSRLLSIERELNYTPSLSRRSSPPLRRYSPGRERSPSARHRKWSPDRLRSRSPGRQRGISPDRKRNWSPDRKRNWSPGRKRSWSPTPRRGSPTPRRGRSPDRQRERSTERKRLWSPEGSRSSDRNRQRSSERRRMLSPERRRQRSVERKRQWSPMRELLQTPKARLGNFNKYPPRNKLNMNPHKLSPTLSPVRSSSPESSLGSPLLDRMKSPLDRITSPLRNPAWGGYQSRQSQASPKQQEAKYSFKGGVWVDDDDDDEEEDLEKYKDWNDLRNKLHSRRK